MSSSALNPNAQSEQPRDKANAIGSSLGCPTKSSYELIECLQNRPARRIVQLANTLFMPWYNKPLSPFGPVVETMGTNPFINKNPIDMLLEGSVQNNPLIISFVADEGLNIISNIMTNESALNELEDRWTELSPHLLDFNFSVPAQMQKEVSLRIKNEYMGMKPISKETVPQLIQLSGDRLYVVDIERAARLQAAATTAPVYMYRFNYRGKHSCSQIRTGSKETFGVSHGDDQIYVLGTIHGNPEESDDDIAVTQRMVEFWTSFAKTGAPVSRDITWSPVQSSRAHIDFLQINSGTDLVMNSSDDLGKRIFWETLPFTEPSYTVKQKRYYKSEL